ncbi:MAG: hypothetical protein ACRDL5_17370 [Solirubrobacteraceae bacterium]
MALARTLTPGYVVVHPNRERAACRLAKLAVVAVLLASAALIMLLTVGGWSKLQGMRPVNFIWAAVYLVFAFYIWRWARGLLPIAAVLAVLLLAFAAIAALGLDGTSWFDRGAAYAPPRSLFGGGGFSTGLLGTLTVVLVAVEAALAAIAMVAFAQSWNVELEVPATSLAARG